jgi:hypothetical protein
MQTYSRQNRAYRYILIIVDVFTRKAYVQPLKTKSKDEVTTAFRAVGAQHGFPELLISDNGSEFLNRSFSQLLKKHNTYHQTNEPGYHPTLGIIDRFSRTFKETIFKYFTQHDTVNWIDNVYKFAEMYNKTPHTSLNNIRPIDVNKHRTEIMNINIVKTEDKSKHQFKIGQIVRKRLKKPVFTKGYRQSWSQRTYIIKEIRGVNATLDNGNIVKLNDLQQISEVPTISTPQQIPNVQRVERESRIIRNIRKEGVQPSAVVHNLRGRKPTNQLVHPKFGKINW